MPYLLHGRCYDKRHSSEFPFRRKPPFDFTWAADAQ